MTEPFHIISDSSCDLPEEYAKNNNVTVVPFYVRFGEEPYKKEREEISVRDFYQRMIDEPDNFPKSSMPSVADFMDAMTPWVEAGIPCVTICITTKFSGAYQSACNARDILLTDHPDAQIAVINSMIDTVLQGLYTIEAVRLRDADTPYEKAVDILEEIKASGRIFFSVANVNYLKVNGRIGKVAKGLTNMLGIRPVITLKEGEIFCTGVGRTRKATTRKSIELLRDYIKETHATPQTYALDIGFGYDYDEAVRFRTDILDMLHGEGFMLDEKDFPIFQIGSGIGVHTGPHPLGVTIIKKALPD